MLVYVGGGVAEQEGTFVSSVLRMKAGRVVRIAGG